MHAKPAMHRRRIDQPAESRSAGEGEVIAFGQHLLGHPRLRIILQRLRHALRPQAGAIHHRVEFEVAAIAAAEGDDPLAVFALRPGDRRVEGNGAACVLDVAAQSQHIRVRIDNAGLRRMQRRGAGQLRLERHRRLRAQHHQPFDIVDLALRGDCLDLGGLLRIGSDDELAALLVRHAVRGAEGVEQPAAIDTVSRAQRPGRVIHAAMNDLAVARGDAGADGVFGFRHDDVVASHGDGARHGQTDDAGADNQYLHADSVSIVCRGSGTKTHGLKGKPPFAQETAGPLILTQIGDRP